MIRNGTDLVEASWDEAMNLITSRSKELLDRKGPLSHGFYTSGQLMLEEYYTLAVIGKAGIGTPHMDGNTRLCTATAAASLKESFGADGQPGSYADLDAAEALFCFGHNVAATQTVLWSRILDRLAGSKPPHLVAVDPRLTPVAQAAEIHLAPRPGTNLALVNGLLQQLIANDWVDHAYVDQHTKGFDALAVVVANYPPARVAEICGVAARDVQAAAEIFGTSSQAVSTVLQGFYQSHQATAAAVAGEQFASATRHAGPTWCRHLADERPANRPEQPRDRCRWRPAGFPQLGQRAARRSAGRALGCGAHRDPELG